MVHVLKKLIPYKWLLILVFALVFAQSISTLILPTLMGVIVDNGVVEGDIPYIYKIGAVMLAVSLLTIIVAVLASFYASKIAMAHGRDLRKDVFSHVQQFSLQEFNELGAASLMTRTTNDITQIQRVIMMMLRMVLLAPLMMVGGIIMAVSKDAKLSLVVLAVIPFLIAAALFILKKGMPLFQTVQKRLDKLNLVLREYLAGIRIIRAFNKEAVESKNWEEANAKLTNKLVQVNKLMAFLMPLMMVLMNLTIVLVILFGSVRINEGNMQIGDLMAFIQYVMQIMFSLVMASMMFVMLPRAAVSANRINEVLQTNPSIKDTEGISEAANQTAKGTLEVDHVSFHYPNADEPALTDIHFTSQPGEVTAIIGGTGSGKTTLINLIPRFYEVTDGSIRVNGVDNRAMTQKEVRSSIGLVPQQAFLFSGTVAANIRYGKNNATMGEIRHAAKIAQVDEFISKMEHGYETHISQGGANLSGGQKQRLAIARALVRQPDIYLFDDSFSALDFKTDAQLRRALKEEVTDASMVIVAQRVTSVLDADRIIVLDNGQVKGIGTHENLLKTSHVYQEIVRSQQGEDAI